MSRSAESMSEQPVTRRDRSTSARTAAASGERARVLLVDDEVLVLEALRLHLDRHFDVSIAPTGVQGLVALRTEGRPFAVVVSDMRMPVMDGAAFLAAARELSPDTVRVMLTGQADLDAAVAAVNEGQIFRFLTKPCPGHVLQSTIEAAVELNRLVSAERVLLQETLTGSIKALIGVLSITHPTAFSRALRMRHRAGLICEQLGCESWEIEIAAMISEVPFVALDKNVVERHAAGHALSDEERAAVDRLPSVAIGLVSGIPRLEPVREILKHVDAPFDGPNTASGFWRSDSVPMGSRVLKAVRDLSRLEGQGIDLLAAIARMRISDAYVPDVLDTLERVSAAPRPSASGGVALPLRDLQGGMILAGDLRTSEGQCILTQGSELAGVLLESLKQLPEGQIQEPIWVCDAQR
jgi:response regulator RpfG family c-di-GMP phosphodiesterase